MDAVLKKKMDVYSAGLTEAAALWRKDPAAHIESQLCDDARQGSLHNFEHRLSALLAYAIHMGYSRGFTDGQAVDTPGGLQVMMTLSMANDIHLHRAEVYTRHRDAAAPGADIVQAAEREIAQYILDRITNQLQCTSVKVV